MAKIPGTDLWSVTRTIVKKGVLLLEEGDREGREFRLYSQVERESLNSSYNYKYSDPQSFYGYCQAFYGGYVVDVVPITYKNQLLFYWNCDDNQTQVRDACIHQRTMAAIRAVIPENPIWDAPLNAEESPVTPRPLRLPVDFFAFVLFDKTTLIAKTITRELKNECNIFVDWVEPVVPPSNRPSPFHSPIPDDVPENEDDPDGYDLGDPPYDPLSNDNGRSYPPPEAPEPPPEPLGPGPWFADMVYTPRSDFPPHDPQGENYTTEVLLGGGSPNVNNPTLGAFQNGPGGWPAVATMTYTNSVGGTQEIQLNGRRQAFDQLISVSFRKAT